MKETTFGKNNSATGL